MKKRTIIAVLALQLVSWGAHFGLVEHDVCAAHGELIHAGEPHADEPLAPIYTNASELQHEHDICALWKSLERTSDSRAVEAIPANCEPDPLVATKRTASNIARLRLAPKTSPPA